MRPANRVPILLAICLGAAACGGKEVSSATATGSGSAGASGGSGSTTSGSTSVGAGGGAAGGTTTGTGGGLGYCEGILPPGAVHYVSCLPHDLPVPVAFRGTAKPGVILDVGPTLFMTLTPLAQGATSMSDGVGNPIGLTGPLGVDCSFTGRSDMFTLPAAANSLMRDLEFEKVTLRGKFTSADRGCAEIDGVVPLINLSLLADGDICVFRLAEPDGPIPSVSDYVCDPASLPPR